MKFIQISLVAALVTMFSCGTGSKPKAETPSNETNVEKQNKKEDYSGIYKTDVSKGCSFSIELKSKGNAYEFSFQGEGINDQGKAFIDPIDGKNYISFDGKIGNNPAGTISGELNEGTIIIQNYGNAMNEYHFFTQCDSKYLEFRKN